MSVIKEPLLFIGTKGEKHLLTMFDSGADISCISPAHVGEIEVPAKLGRTRRLSTASEAHYIEITQRVTLDFYIDGILLCDDFLIVPGLSEEAVIGVATLQKWRIKLDFELDRVIVDSRYSRLQLI